LAPSSAEAVTPDAVAARNIVAINAVKRSLRWLRIISSGRIATG
jgi:hypothetical protein